MKCVHSACIYRHTQGAVIIRKVRPEWADVLEHGPGDREVRRRGQKRIDSVEGIPPAQNVLRLCCVLDGDSVQLICYPVRFPSPAVPFDEAVIVTVLRFPAHEHGVCDLSIGPAGRDELVGHVVGQSHARLSHVIPVSILGDLAPLLNGATAQGVGLLQKVAKGGPEPILRQDMMDILVQGVCVRILFAISGGRDIAVFRPFVPGKLRRRHLPGVYRGEPPGVSLWMSDGDGRDSVPRIVESLIDVFPGPDVQHVELPKRRNALHIKYVFSKYVQRLRHSIHSILDDVGHLTPP